MTTRAKPLASIRVVGPDGKWSPEALQFLLNNDRVSRDTDAAAGTLAGLLTTLAGRVTTAETNIVSNDGDIAANAADILALEERVDELTNLNQSLFDEVKVIEKTPIITLNSGFGLSMLRDIQTVSGTGAITPTGGEIRLSTGATATSVATLESAQVGTYVPGNGSQVGVGVRMPTAPTGNQFAKWGGLSVDGTDGFYYGVDASGFYVARLNAGVETIVRQTDFNLDKLDGTGESGVTINLATGYIFHIDYAYYGHGPIVFSVARFLNGRNTWIKMHAFEVDGSVSVGDPNLAIYANVSNGADASNFDAYIGGRQYSIMGKYVPNRRITGQERGSVSTSTTAVPLITFRRKSGFGDRSLIMDGFTVDVGSQPVIVEVRLNGSLTGASYAAPSNVTAAETALEVDRSATAITGGEVVWSAYFAAGSGSNRVTDRASLGLDIPRAQPVTLCVRTLSGAGTIFSHMLMAEEW